jgi:hypothetical protein
MRPSTPAAQQQITSDNGDVLGLSVKYRVAGGKIFFETVTLFQACEQLARMG